jgi:hypothetical protein
MYTHSIVGRTGLLVAIVATLSGLLAANVAGELASSPTAAFGTPQSAAEAALPVLPEVVVTATPLGA